MLKSKFTAAALAGCLCWAWPVLADDHLAEEGAAAADSEMVDVTETTCGELAEATEMDRAFSLMFYYGYLIGRDDVAVIDGAAVAEHLERVRDFCNANADATVVDAFVSALGDDD